MKDKKFSKRFLEGERHILETLQRSDSQTRETALQFLEKQSWIEQGGRLVSEDMFQRDTPEAYFRLLEKSERESLNAVAQKNGVGVKVSLKAEPAKAFFEENGLILQLQARKFER